MWTTLSSSYKYKIGGYCSRLVTLATGSLSSTTFASGAINDSVIASSAANKIADQTLRRSTANIEASSNGDTLTHKSLYGAVAKQQHKNDIATVSGSKVLRTYRNDGTTILSTRDITTQSGAAPVVGVDD